MPASRKLSASTSRTRKVSAVKDEATALASKITRATKGPWCQAGCGHLATDAAHIIGRTISVTRTDLTNLLALCAKCHANFHQWDDEWMAFLAKPEPVGMPEYWRLKAKAQAGVNQKFDWYDELDRLRAIWNQIEEAA